MIDYVEHALNLSLEDRMAFVHSLQQDIVELEPMLYDHQDPEDRMTLQRIIVNSRHALRELGYDVLPGYSLNAEYEDNPPEYSRFARLPSYEEAVEENNKPQRPTERLLKTAKRAVKMAAKKTSQHVQSLYRRVKSIRTPQHGIERPPPPSLNGQEETGRAGQQTMLRLRRDSLNIAAEGRV